MVITLCSLPLNILCIMILIIGLLNLKLCEENTLIFEDTLFLSRSQFLDEASMSLESHFLVVSYQFSDTEDRSLYSHTAISTATLDPSGSHPTWTYDRATKLLLFLGKGLYLGAPPSSFGARGGGT